MFFIRLSYYLAVLFVFRSFSISIELCKLDIVRAARPSTPYEALIWLLLLLLVYYCCCFGTLRYVDYVAVAVLLIVETNCVVELSMHISYTIIIFSLNLCLLHTNTHSQRVTALTVRFGFSKMSDDFVAVDVVSQSHTCDLCAIEECFGSESDFKKFSFVFMNLVSCSSRAEVISELLFKYSTMEHRTLAIIIISYCERNTYT